MNKEQNTQKEVFISIREHINGSRIEKAMNFADKLSLLIADNGIEYLKQRAFVNALADYQLFNQATAYKNSLLLMLDNGLIERLIKIDYTLYKLEIDRFCDEYAMQREVVYCLSEAIAIAIGKTSSNGLAQKCTNTDIFTGLNEESNIFVPSNDGKFRPLLNVPENVSFNDIAKILGHDTNQYYTYIPGIGADINIMFESFTGNILYVYVYKKTKELDVSRVKSALREYSFTSEYDYSDYCDDIEEGIRKGNLSKDFFKQVLNQESDVMFDGRFNTKLIFENNKLVKMESLDSLSTEAKSLRDTSPSQYNRIKKYAESFNFSQNLVFKEINMQVDAFYHMPLTLFDNFSEFYVEVNDDIWSTNYVMCAVAYAKKQINFEEFKLISHEEYSKLGEYRSNGGVHFAAYEYLNHVCFFDLENGNFICCYKNGDSISPESNINPDYINKF